MSAFFFTDFSDKIFMKGFQLLRQHPPPLPPFYNPLLAWPFWMDFLWLYYSTLKDSTYFAPSHNDTFIFTWGEKITGKIFLRFFFLACLLGYIGLLVLGRMLPREREKGKQDGMCLGRAPGRCLFFRCTSQSSGFYGGQAFLRGYSSEGPGLWH